VKGSSGPPQCSGLIKLFQAFEQDHSKVLYRMETIVEFHHLLVAILSLPKSSHQTSYWALLNEQDVGKGKLKNTSDADDLVNVD
jgi:hypothetical protein